MKSIKKIFSVIVITLIVLSSFGQSKETLKDTLNGEATSYMSLSSSENCIYFSSMDWFNVVDCYDENGKQMFHSNVKNDAKKQISQFIVMDYSSFDDGEYTIVLKFHSAKMFATFRVFDNGSCVLLYNNN